VDILSVKQAERAYEEARAAYQKAEAIAQQTGDPRHQKYAQALRRVAIEKAMAAEHEYQRSQILAHERRNAQLNGKRLPP
jgi:hypothetical protein